MIITCPSCTSMFSLDDSLISPRGRKLKCAKCKHVWHHEHPNYQFSSMIASKDEPAKPENAKQNKQDEINIDKFIKDIPETKVSTPTKALVLLYLPKVVFFAITAIMLTFTSLIFFRNELGLVGKMQPFYDSIGYHDTTMMKISDLNIQKTFTTQGNFLLFSGSITNSSEKNLESLYLRVVIRDRNNNELVKQIFPYTGAKSIAPNEKIDIKFPMKIWFNPDLMNFVEVDIASKLEFALGLR